MILIESKFAVGKTSVPVAFGGITTLHSRTPFFRHHEDDALPYGVSFDADANDIFFEGLGANIMFL